MTRAVAIHEVAEVAALSADLAPGDALARRFDTSSIRVRRIRSPDDPGFGVAYERLWREFGDRGEMEKRDVIAARLAWDPARAIGPYRYLYEMLVIECGEEMVALRDHTAIVPADTSIDSVPVIVHLSHVLIEPAWRGKGLAAWLRAFPLQTAREGAAAGGRSAGSITLVAEMEPPTAAEAATLRRLGSYGAAGFKKIDPARARYAQPDFRSAAAIDASRVEPVPLELVIRRVGKEDEARIRGAEIREIVAALYALFAVHVSAEHMAPLWSLHAALPSADEWVELVPPTS